jgi:hypothetical protein
MVIGLGVLVGGVVVVVVGGVVVLVGGVVVVVVGGVVVVDVVHTGFVIVFDSRVTAPLRANSRPSIVALVLAAIDVSARIVP